jgi:hypothetical protein
MSGNCHGAALDRRAKARRRGSNTDNQTGRRDDPVIGTEHSGPQPTNARHEMGFCMKPAQISSLFLGKNYQLREGPSKTVVAIDTGFAR